MVFMMIYKYFNGLHNIYFSCKSELFNAAKYCDANDNQDKLAIKTNRKIKPNLVNFSFLETNFVSGIKNINKQIGK